MKIIDDQGRFLGKINVIDLLVILFLLCMLPLFSLGHRLLINRRVSLVEKTKVVAEKVIPFTLVNIKPEVLGLIAVGDKEVNELGEEIGKITWIGEVQPSKRIVNLGRDENLTITDPTTRELPVKIKIKAEIKENKLLYKKDPIAIDCPVRFKTNKYSVSAVYLSSENKDKRIEEYIEVPFKFIKIDPEVIKLIKVGDAELDNEGNILCEVLEIGESKEYKHRLNLASYENQQDVIDGETSLSAKDTVLRELPVKLRLRVETEGNNIYYKGKKLTFVSPVYFKTDKYYVEAAIAIPTKERREKWVEVKVKIASVTPEIGSMIKEGYIERDRASRIIGKLKAITSNNPSQIQAVKLEENKLIVINDPFRNDIIASLELLCLIGTDESLYFKDFPVKVGSQITFVSDLYMVSGAIIGINSN